MRLNQQMNLKPPGKDGFRSGRLTHPNDGIIETLLFEHDFLEAASRELAAVPSGGIAFCG